MPKIQLKPHSPEFEDQRESIASHVCEMPGCTKKAEHRAPKDRSLSEYYRFCLQHVSEYNKAWDFFAGMSSQEVEDHMINSIYGDRPTWRYDVNSFEDLHRSAWQIYNFSDADPYRSKDKKFEHPQRDTKELEALAVMGLDPPITLKDIKTRYKELAKKHHPDLNPGCTKSENRLKQINMAYTILKLAYSEYEKLPEKD